MLVEDAGATSLEQVVDHLRAAVPPGTSSARSHERRVLVAHVRATTWAQNRIPTASGTTGGARRSVHCLYLVLSVTGVSVGVTSAEVIGRGRTLRPETPG